MKTLITYSSKTGNTKMIAEAILEVLPKDTKIALIEEDIDPNKFEIILIGFWVDKTLADEKIRNYTKRVKGKKIGIFATLGEYPDTQHAKDALKGMRDLLEVENEVIKEFICQGKIDSKITEYFETLPPTHPMYMTAERRKKHEDASTHPDKDDIKNAQEAFKDIC